MEAQVLEMAEAKEVTGDYACSQNDVKDSVNSLYLPTADPSCTYPGAVSHLHTHLSQDHTMRFLRRMTST